MSLLLPGRYLYWLSVVIIGSAVFTHPVSAGDVARIKIGPFSKRVYGTLSSASAGDTACYLHMKDDKGAAFDEMAEFDFCEPRNMRRYGGKRLALTYAMESVLSAECDGNMDCGKSDRVALIKKLRIAPARSRKK